MTTKMEEGFRGEKMTRQQAQDEVKRTVKKDLDALKEEKACRGEVEVCSDANTGVGLGSPGTFARPPALASRFNDIFLPRKMAGMYRTRKSLDMCYGSKDGFATLLVPKQFCTFRDHGNLKRDAKQISSEPRW